jgi:ORF6N domain
MRIAAHSQRNLDRFPADFMFRLTAAEANALRSQSATSNTRRGGRRYLPYAFTEHGAIQAANVLNSPRAVEMGIRHARPRTVTRTPKSRGIGFTADLD